MEGHPSDHPKTLLLPWLGYVRRWKKKKKKKMPPKTGPRRHASTEREGMVGSKQTICQKPRQPSNGEGEEGDEGLVKRGLLLLLCFG